MSPSRKLKGFTLIELLLVIAIIAILAAIVIIAINPARQLAQANDTQRRSNVNTILNAIGQYTVDNRGQVPEYITENPGKEICPTNSATSTDCANLRVLTDNDLYLPMIPTDPTGETATTTGYWVKKSAGSNPRITVWAPSTEIGADISVTR